MVLALRGGGSALDLSFSVVCDSTFLGEDIGVVGECEELGQWKNVLRMTALEVCARVCARARKMPARTAGMCASVHNVRGRDVVPGRSVTAC